MKGFLFIGFLLVTGYAYGTHLRSAEIKVERVSCDVLTFKITVTAYTNTNSSTPFGGNTFEDGHISFGDGLIVLIPTTPATPRPDLGPNIGTASFTTFHTYAQLGEYKINYYEHDRNATIINIFNPGDTPFSAFVIITESSILNCNRYPKLSIPPVDNTCPGVSFFHNSGAFDEDGDSLSYELTIPSRNVSAPVDGYFSPAAQQFYTNFSQGNEERDGPPSFVIDGNTGLITWNAPGHVGEYNIAFKILEWRRNSTTAIVELLSVTIRDMQITVEDCQNGRPDVIIPVDLCVVAGTVIDETVFGFDPEGDDVKIELVSEIFSLSFQPPILNPSIVEFRDSDPADTVKIYWQTDCLHVRDQAYQIVIKITDSPHFGIQLVTFKTWRIKIIAPTPVWKNISLDLINRKSIIEWEPYTCVNAQFIQVWRKVGHYSYNPGQCGTGLPKYLGYELIAEVNPADTIFNDNNSTRGLVDGALYCYRLVASFAQPAGGKSYVTTEQCVGPILTDAPVITHVSVENTDQEEGAIRVSWRSPFNIDGNLFPKPYQYHVYRGNGFSSDTGLQKVGEVLVDTTFVNSSLNTADSIFNYRIVIYSKPVGYLDFIAVDTSFAASSVRLSAVPGEEKIELDWSATVPWSNTIEGSPLHYIFRGLKDTEQLTLLAQADVTENGFVFADETADPSEYYCYRVMTRGTYGSPLIDTLRNFSQKVCLYPINDLPVCAPVLTVEPADCDSFLSRPDCSMEFKNKLSWTFTANPGCRFDIVRYQVYASASPDGNFDLVLDLSDTTFTDRALPSYAKCYKVASVDSQGHISEVSNASCNDNCPFYELPNVFTPGAMDGFNDTFRALNSYHGEGSSCLYFINAVKFKVYNSWGKEVYSSNTADGLPTAIEWNGTGNNGNELESGVYFYLADVYFDVLDKSRKNKTLKGWVHLVR